METCVGWGGGLLLLLLLLLWFGAGLGHGGLPENVARCAFFCSPARGFSRQVLVLPEFWAVVVRFCRQARWFSRLMETFVGWGGGLLLPPCTFCMFFDAVGVGFVRLRSIFVAVGVGFVRLAGCFPRLLRGFFRCRWPEARILRGFVAHCGLFS